MLANVEQYGFSWELQAEPWHIRYVAGDDLPVAVLAYEGKVHTAPIEPVECVKDEPTVPPAFPPYDPANGKYSLWPLNGQKATIALGSLGESVVYLQDVIHFETGMRIESDGHFGPKTDLLVKKVQGWNGLEADGWVGPKTWALIDQYAASTG